MYLILKAIDINGNTITKDSTYDKCGFRSYFVDDLQVVKVALDHGHRVFKLDILTELRSIEATYQEVTMETENG